MIGDPHLIYVAPALFAGAFYGEDETENLHLSLQMEDT